MRTKEVEEAIDILKSDAEWNGNTHCLETVLNYIGKLEYQIQENKIKEHFNGKDNLIG